jgi:hypothetical protein
MISARIWEFFTNIGMGKTRREVRITQRIGGRETLTDFKDPISLATRGTLTKTT